MAFDDNGIAYELEDWDYPVADPYDEPIVDVAYILKTFFPCERCEIMKNRLGELPTDIVHAFSKNLQVLSEIDDVVDEINHDFLPFGSLRPLTSMQLVSVFHRKKRDQSESVRKYMKYFTVNRNGKMTRQFKEKIRYLTFLLHIHSN